MIPKKKEIKRLFNSSHAQPYRPEVVNAQGSESDAHCVLDPTCFLILPEEGSFDYSLLYLHAVFVR